MDQKTADKLANDLTMFSGNLDTFEPEAPHGPFFVYSVLGGEYGTTPVAWISINPWTGDAWDIWACKRLSTKVLRRDQAVLRKHISPQKYAKLHALKPECEGF